MKDWLLTNIVTPLYALLKPLIINEIKEVVPILGDAVKAEVPELTNAVSDELQKQMPIIIHAVVVAITTTLSEAAVRGVDKITDLVPGQMDDNFIDPLVQQISDRLGGILGGGFHL